MTVPAIAAQRFASGLILGAILGIWYDFLRPLRPRLTGVSDLLFLAGAGWAWLELMFGICLGDIRMSALLSLALGLAVWEKTASTLIRPLFSCFWRGLIGLIRIFLLPCKKILEK